MKLNHLPAGQAWLMVTWCVLGQAAVGSGDPVAVNWDAERWDLSRATVADHLGRSALAGTAFLTDAEFGDGVIEVDVAVNGSRSYPGIVFRVQSAGEYERLYVRPHRAGLYPDAVQYAPVFNGVACWQLYHGEGFSAAATIPADQWVTLRVEIRNTQARVFLNESEEPVLTIHDLKHGSSKGTIGVMGPADGTAWFSKFRYQATGELEFDSPPQRITPAGTLTDWQISRPYPAGRIDRASYPPFFQVYYAGWRPVAAEHSGLVNLSRHVKRPGQQAHCVYARTVVHSDERQDVRLSVGYSDDVTVFLNGKPLFSGTSGYRSRDPSFVGVVGLFDTVYLPLRKGLNEVCLLVTESFGGWGFMCRTDRPLDPPIKRPELLTKVWETPADFKVPESVLYDAKRDVLFVSSFDRVDPSHVETGFISKVGTDGQIRDLEWVTGLDGPCGMGISGDRLYVVEGFRGDLVEIDLDSGEILGRHAVPGHKFLNDLVIDASGSVLISNTSRVLAGWDLYSYAGGVGEVWKSGCDLHRTNGLFMHDGMVVAGSTGDGLLKTVSLQDGHVNNITSLGAGVIDGIRVDNEGHYLVSHWEGKVYRVSPTGTVVELLDTTQAGLNCADFEFIKDDNLLVIPTFMGNKLVAYRLGIETGA